MIKHLEHFLSSRWQEYINKKHKIEYIIITKTKELQCKTRTHVLVQHLGGVLFVKNLSTHFNSSFSFLEMYRESLACC